jgi:hypothetical protein
MIPETIWITHLINETRAILERTDAAIRDRRRFNKQFKKYIKSRPKSHVSLAHLIVQPSNRVASAADISEWKVDESGNLYREIRG